MAATTQYYFTTGNLYYLPVVETVDELFNAGNGVLLSALQSISVAMTWQKRDLFGPPTESLYPLATAHYNGQVEFVAAVASINADALVEIVGMVQEGAYLDIMPQVLPIPFLSLLLQGQDHEGKPIQFAMPRVCFPGTSFAMRRDDWAIQNLRGEGYPSKESGILGKVCYIRWADS